MAANWANAARDVTLLLHGSAMHFYSATHMHSADYAVARCLSVRLSVTRQYCV